MKVVTTLRGGLLYNKENETKKGETEMKELLKREENKIMANFYYDDNEDFDDKDGNNWTVEDLDEYFGGEDNWPNAD